MRYLTTVPEAQRPACVYFEALGQPPDFRGYYRVDPSGRVEVSPKADPLEVQAVLEHKARIREWAATA